MPITTSCPGCKALFRLPEELAGKNVRCQKCERLFLVPLLGLESKAAPASEPVATQIPPAPELPAEQPTVPAPTSAAPVEETLVVAPRPETPPAVKSTPAPERPPSRAWLLAMIVLFILALLMIGGFASLWVATHLAAPTRAMIVPPFRGTNRDGLNRDHDDGRVRRDFKDDFRVQRAVEPTRIIVAPKGQTTTSKDLLSFVDPGVDAGRFGNNGPFHLYSVFLQ